VKIGWGIVSTARIADEAVAPAIRGSGATIVGVCSRDEGRARAFAERHDARHALTRYEDLLALPGVDAVYIASPNALHAEQVCAAAAAGKHVLCDKPLATDAGAAQRAVEACHTADVRLGVNYQARHNDAVVAARELVATGRIGDVALVECEVAVARGHRTGWRTDRALAGLGTVHNLGVHALDLIGYVTATRVTEVTAILDAALDERPETTALVLMRLSTGALARVTATEAASRPSAVLTIEGSAGRIVGRGLTPPARGPAQLAVLVGDEPERTTQAPTADAFPRAIAEFARAIAEGREPNAGGGDGLASAQLVAAIAQSARTGTRVRLAQP
jgi:1,5-anhydro-D-fructose reductase (1,5-anhydro-D-mannitol-forming)